MAGYYHPDGKAGEARYATIAPVPLRCQLNTLGFNLMSGFAGVCEMYEGHLKRLRRLARLSGSSAARFSALIAHISANRSGRL